ncbi:VOC family protein [Robertmurraya massiliosenegalensis]|uniref:VOC family protein n=1 Tax=Robertmurraya massiliosenegalensis TaxID=1287657 RepID=UPI0002F6F373|nr:VOC family protein [Robertmurraya massiliosenegalensis]
MFRVGSIFIPVTDLDNASDWYEKNLGVKKIDSWEDGVGFYFSESSTQLALVKVETTQPSEFVIKGKRKNIYYNFLVQNIEEAYQHLTQNGVSTTEIEDFGGMKGFDFFDLDGNPFSVVDEEPESPFHLEQIRKRQEKD